MEQLYRVGSATLVQRRNVELSTRVLRALTLQDLPPFSNPAKFAEWWNELDRSGKLKQALLPVLSVQEGNITVEQAWDEALPETRARILQDFFVLNFSQ